MPGPVHSVGGEMKKKKKKRMTLSLVKAAWAWQDDKQTRRTASVVSPATEGGNIPFTQSGAVARLKNSADTRQINRRKAYPSD